jgi:hypothetical protein
MMKKMKRSTRSNTILSRASTLGDAQLGDVRGGASMVEYALLSNPPTLATNPPTLATNPPTLATARDTDVDRVELAS